MMLSLVPQHERLFFSSALKLKNYNISHLAKTTLTEFRGISQGWSLLCKLQKYNYGGAPLACKVQRTSRYIQLQMATHKVSKIDMLLTNYLANYRVARLLYY